MESLGSIKQTFCVIVHLGKQSKDVFSLDMFASYTELITILHYILQVTLNFHLKSRKEEVEHTRQITLDLELGSQEGDGVAAYGRR